MKFASFDNFLKEDRVDTNTKKQAIEMGLQYNGFGHWKDPRTGKITHKTQDDQLVPIDDTQLPMADGAVGDASQAKPGMMQQPQGAQPQQGSGVLGAPEPGTEQYPRGGNWNPGPNGDNCVTGQPPPKDLSFDMFVGKTNYVKWTAGKDGSNYKNVNYKKMADEMNDEMKEVVSHSFDTFLKENPQLAAPPEEETENQQPALKHELGGSSPRTAGGASNSEKLKQQGFQHTGFNNYQKQDGTRAKIIAGEIIYYNATGEVEPESDGGLKMMGAKPTWKRPDDGQAMTPPAHPETPDEIAAVPDAVPATPPMGYDKFMNSKSLAARKQQELQFAVDQQKSEVDNKYSSVPLGNAFNLRMNGFIDELINSEDPEQQMIGSIMMDSMIDNADTFVQTLNDVDIEKRPAAIQSMARMIERDARISYLRDQEPEVEEEKIEGEVESPMSSELEDVDEMEPDEVENPLLQKELDDQTAEAEQFEKDFNTTAEDYLNSLGPRKVKETRQFMNDMRERLKSLSPERRNTYQNAVASAYTYTGRINSGSGKNDLGYVDTQQLVGNRDRLLQGYGDGSPEEVFKFVKSVRNQKIDEQFFESSFNTLPVKLQEALGKKGLVTADAYVSDDKADKDIHYLGTDEDGNEVRGDLVSKENKDMRARLMWRIYLEQGGVDGYTGLPLVLESMDLEHVVGFNNSTNGQPGREEWKQRENDKNFVMINSNINQKKSDLSMEEFFNEQVNPLEGKTEAQFGGVKNVRDKQNQIKSQNTERAKTLTGKTKGASGYKEMTDDTNVETLTGYFKQDDDAHASLRNEFKEAATNDKEKKKAASIKANMGSRLVKQMGLKRSVVDKSGRRRTEPAENVYRGFLISMASASPKDRKKYYKGWETSLKIANEERSHKALTNSLKEQGLITDEVLNDKKLGKVFKEDYIHVDELYLLEDIKSFSMFMSKLNN